MDGFILNDGINVGRQIILLLCFLTKNMPHAQEFLVLVQRQINKSDQYFPTLRLAEGYDVID